MTDAALNSTSYILTFKCRDQLGLFAAVANVMHDHGAFVVDMTQHGDQQTKQYFSRIVFDDRHLNVPMEVFKQAIHAMAQDKGMDYKLRRADYRPKVLIAVSRYDHCLNVLLTKWRSGVLAVDIAGVVSNHDDCRPLVEFYGIPYHHLPITPETKPQQEARILQIMDETQTDLLVLARYMQILSDDMCRKITGKAINIHHSFLPSFKGARPYHQASERGVKVIGATAHYVTVDLDEGPIIVQEVTPVDHTFTVEDMVHLGHDNESTALAKAVRLHVEERVLLNGSRTVIL
jgi:formyltetrahydrofolate deformylase